jgi:hypothetical protein
MDEGPSINDVRFSDKHTMSFYFIGKLSDIGEGVLPKGNTKNLTSLMKDP